MHLLIYIYIYASICTCINIYIYTVYTFVCGKRQNLLIRGLLFENGRLTEITGWKRPKVTMASSRCRCGILPLQQLGSVLCCRAWTHLVNKTVIYIYIYIVMWYWKWWELHKMLDLGISINHKTSLNIPRWSEIMRWDPAKALVRGNSTGYPSTFASPLKRWVDAFSAVAEWQGLMIIDINSS
jgi:hypothetical protein